MNRYPVTATLISPLVIRRNRQSERSEGVSSVSGTVVRGGLAHAYLQWRGEPDQRFLEVFDDESRCRFGPLDPAPGVFPLTAQSCKRVPGFLAEGKHGMADALWLRIAQHLSSDPGRIELRECRAPMCGNDLKAHSGFYGPAAHPHHDGTAGASTLLKQRKLVSMVTAHVGIDRATTTAAESIFYTLEAVEPETVTHEASEPDERFADLVGWIDADETVAATIQASLRENDFLIDLGHARTRGYGRTRFEIVEGGVDFLIDSADEGTHDHRSARLKVVARSQAVTNEADRAQGRERWSEQLLDYLSEPELAVTGLDPRRSLAFSLTFRTGAVLVDDLLRSTLDPADIARWLPPLPEVDEPGPWRSRPTVDVDGGQVRCLAAVTGHERVRGWNAAHGLPRQDEWAVARGAVYAYLFEGDADARDRFQKRLNRLEHDGVGLRRNEGFGSVVISDEFHRIYHRQEGVSAQP
jgi:CRISPR-associated Csx10 family RAMP protein